jgi:hypothetical protein
VLLRRAATLAAILAGAAAIALAGCSTAGQLPGTGHAGPYTVTAPTSAAGLPAVPDRGRAELDILSGATSIAVRTGHIGGDLLRVSAPAGAGVRPRLMVHGTARLRLDSTGTGGPATVRITLNSGVSWRLVFDGGTDRTSVFLGRGALRAAEFAAGSSSITMRLPRPRGTVPIVLAGGASLVRLTAPAGVPARLSLDGGAGHATLGRRRFAGVAGGTVLTSPDWATAADRYDITAPAGISAITVGSW